MNTRKLLIVMYICGILTLPVLSVITEGYEATEDRVTEMYCNAGDFVGLEIDYCSTEE